eukprot:112113_1
MNKTQIVGYRRLRTLSQLFFETMPQILLQLRILLDDNNRFKIDVNTLLWSIGLAVAHLFLEGGIIYLDKSAFKLSFMEYALECLGGRVNWIPFSNRINNIIRNQIYICGQDDANLRVVSEQTFNPATLDVIDDNYDALKYSSLVLDYEQILSDITCINYAASFQFSPQSMARLTDMIIRCPAMIVPPEFKLLSTNVALQKLMRHLLCKAQIKLGVKSIGDTDINSLCKLYKASTGKIKLNLNEFNAKVVSKLLKSLPNSDD